MNPAMMAMARREALTNQSLRLVVAKRLSRYV
jgi:hypothetical protein